MGWLYLLGALAFPPVFILWRPREPLAPRARRVRLAAAIVVVWMLTILWTQRGTLGADPRDELRGEMRDFTPSRQEELRRRAAAEEAAGARDDAGDREGPRPRERSAGEAGSASRPADPSADVGPARGNEPTDPDTDVSFNWSLDAPADAGLMLALGWVPGLVYAGLLMLARKAMEPPQATVVEDDAGQRGAW
jgi:hypothetical protein